MDTLNAVAVSVVPTTAVTVTVIALDVLPPYVLSPEYTAVNEAVCAVLKLVVSAVTPELSVALPSTVVPL